MVMKFHSIPGGQAAAFGKVDFKHITDVLGGVDAFEAFRLAVGDGGDSAVIGDEDDGKLDHRVFHPKHPFAPLRINKQHAGGRRQFRTRHQALALALRGCGQCDAKTLDGLFPPFYFNGSTRRLPADEAPVPNGTLAATQQQ